MRRARFEWDQWNLAHLARHGVDWDEVEAVLAHDPLILRTSDGKYLAYGQTDGGDSSSSCLSTSPGP